jgi:c-di-GMP-binding flagellar brake protein YcgR
MFLGRLLPSVDNKNEVLQCAADKEAVVSIISENDEWHICKSRFKPDYSSDCIRIKTPVDKDGNEVHYEIGKEVEADFRCGHRKMMFNAKVIDTSDCLKLSIPFKVYCLPRKAYQRMPARRKVIIWPNSQKHFSGFTKDLSAGGMSVIIPERVQEDWVGRTVKCQVTIGDRHIHAKTLVRSMEDMPATKQTQLSVQFVGMEMTENGRRSLSTIAKEVVRFRKQLAISERNQKDHVLRRRTLAPS